MQRNRLAAETSPYLLQHADNPVDWFPWGEQALLTAKQQNKPILLSIGYSACHWCHVMAHESFEDPATAAVMNQLFVNIKVDREERPDLDKIYQVAQQLITHGSGGWPLTMFLTPSEQAPFFGGTYFPREPRYGMPAFSDLLRRVAEYYRNHGAEIARQNQQLKLAFAGLAPEPAPDDATLDTSPLREARTALERSFDAQFGGFSQAPKFPHPGSIERCMRHWHGTSASTSPDLKALYMASLTLTRMAEGGIYDQLGGGFSRYSVDDHWMIPHFEKMLYDNGQLLAEYSRASLATGEALFARIAGETADWVLRDMRSPQGGFYSSLDADSEGHEGKFYVWTRAEVQGLLTPQEYAAFSRRFGLDRSANFEGEWHLHTYESIDAIAAVLGESAQGIAALIASAQAKLLKLRELRVWPARDEKILTAWNALMIKGLAIAARVLHRPDLADAATAADHEQLIHRSKTFSDDSLPSGNGVAASVLCRLGYLLGELPYLDAAERTLRAGWPVLQQYPQAHMSLANALEEFLSSMQILIVRGDAPQIESWTAGLSASYAPTRMIFAIPRDAAELPPALAEKRATADTVAYVCSGMT